MDNYKGFYERWFMSINNNSLDSFQKIIYDNQSFDLSYLKKFNKDKDFISLFDELQYNFPEDTKYLINMFYSDTDNMSSVELFLQLNSLFLLNLVLDVSKKNKIEKQKEDCQKIFSKWIKNEYDKNYYQSDVNPISSFKDSTVKAKTYKVEIDLSTKVPPAPIPTTIIVDYDSFVSYPPVDYKKFRLEGEVCSICNCVFTTDKPTLDNCFCEE